jgi:hypothetical protein
MSGYRPVRTLRVRNGDLYGFDGIAAPFRWDGIAAAAWQAGVIAPTAAPQITQVVGGAVTAGLYYFGYRYVDITLGTTAFPNGVPSCLSPLTTVNAAQGNGFAWANLQAAAVPARISRIELYRTTSGQGTTLYLIAAIGQNGTFSAVASASGSAKLTVPVGHNLVVGAVITVAGGVYNGTTTVTAVTSTTVTTTLTYSATDSGTWVLSGFNEPTFANGTISTVTNSSGTALYTTSSAHGLKIGAGVTTAGILSSADALIPSYNVTGVVATVPTTSEFTLSVTGTPVAYTVAGNSGTWVLSSYNGPVPSGAVGAGQITVGTNSSGATIFTTSANHGLFVGDIVKIQGTSVLDYNVTQQITAVPTSNTFVTGTPYETDILAGYSTGTVTTNATATLVGSGTSWTQAMVGQWITITSEPNPFQIAAVYSATQLTLSAAATTTGGLSYAIAAGFWWQAAMDDNTLATINALGVGLYAQLPIVGADGYANANRFVPPNNFNPFCVMFQDRVLLAGSVKYTAGTVTTNGTTTVTGSGTAWTTAMGDGNREIIIAGEPAPIKIASVASGTSLTLATAATTSAGSLSYVIKPLPIFRNQINYSETNEPESMLATNTITVQENTGDDDEVTGLIRHGFHAYLLKERHLYAIQFIRQPNIDAQCYLIADRGAVSDRCVAWQDGLCFILDQKGVYTFNGVSVVQDISTPIGDLWRNGILDFSKSQWWFAVSDPAKHIVQFWVTYTGDSGTYPTRALTYHIDTGAWGPETYVWQVGGACVASINGQALVYIGKENDEICLTGAGVSEIVPTAITGTATGATSDTLTDSTASFTSAVIDAPLAIVAGTGKGQWARIINQTSTQLTIQGSWATTPDTTSQYAVGAIQWQHKGGMLQFPVSGTKNKRSVNLFFDPTTNPATLDLRLYQNYNSTPISNVIAETRRPGVSTTAASPDVVFNMQSAYDAYDVNPGYNEYYYAGLTEDRLPTWRYTTVELRGFQTLDPITIYQYEVQGSQP